MIADSNIVSRVPCDEAGHFLCVGAQLCADVAKGEVTVSFQVNLCNSEGDEFFGAHSLYGKRSVADVLVHGLKGLAAPRAVKRVTSPTSVADATERRPG